MVKPVTRKFKGVTDNSTPDVDCANPLRGAIVVSATIARDARVVVATAEVTRSQAMLTGACVIEQTRLP
jgi:hypothetical protein